MKKLLLLLALCSSLASAQVTTSSGRGFSSMPPSTSAQLRAVLTDETGTGLAVFNNGPTFISPILGNATFGTATANRMLSVTGSYTGTTNSTGLIFLPTLTVPASGQGIGMSIAPTIVEAASGVHTNLTGMAVSATFTDGVATATKGSALSVGAPVLPAGTVTGATINVTGPSTGATTNHAIWLESGAIGFGTAATSDSARNTAANMGAPHMLCASAVAVSAGAVVTKEILYTCAIPAGAMGANGVLRWNAYWTTNNDASAKTARIELGGTAFYQNDLASSVSAVAAASLQNRNSAASQVARPLTQSTATANATGTVNTAVAQDLVFSCQKADAGDTCTLESITVEVIYRP